jgi:RNA polymerase sigma-70 factor (ECF subfamily)
MKPAAVKSTMAVNPPVADESRPEIGNLEAEVVSALYVEHAEELRRFLVGVLRDAQLAADVLQATFVKAIQVGSTSREETRKAWLFRVAYHEAMAIRRRQGVDGRALQQVAWTRPGAARSADEPVLRFETVETVRRAIDELPAAQREVLEQRIYAEKTFAEIAKELNIPLGTALARMRAALAKLRPKLAADES